MPASASDKIGLVPRADQQHSFTTLLLLHVHTCHKKSHLNGANFFEPETEPW